MNSAEFGCRCSKYRAAVSNLQRQRRNALRTRRKREPFAGLPKLNAIMPMTGISRRHAMLYGYIALRDVWK